MLQLAPPGNPLPTTLRPHSECTLTPLSEFSPPLIPSYRSSVWKVIVCLVHEVSRWLGLLLQYLIPCFAVSRLAGSFVVTAKPFYLTTGIVYNITCVISDVLMWYVFVCVMSGFHEMT